MPPEDMLKPLGPTDFNDTMAGAQAGMDWAFAALFREWNPPLIRFFRARAPSAAEDLASEVWVTAAGRLVDFQGGESDWRAWLFTLAHRRAIDYQRRLARRRTDPVANHAMVDQVAPDDPAQETVNRVSAQAAIDAMVARLTAEQVEVILLRVVAGLDSAQVAKIVGRDPGWVRVTQHRALRRLADDSFFNQPAAL